MATLQQKFDWITRYGDLTIDKRSGVIRLWWRRSELQDRLNDHMVVLKIRDQEIITRNAFNEFETYFRAEEIKHFVHEILEAFCVQRGIYNAMILASAIAGAAGKFRRKDGDDAILCRVVDFL